MLSEPLHNEIAQLIVSSLNLEMKAEDIDLDEPLYGKGLGLDSIDILEISLAISKRYGVQLRASDVDNHEVFTSVHTLANYIAAHRTT